MRFSFFVSLAASILVLMAGSVQGGIPVGVAWDIKSEMSEQLLQSMQETLKTIAPSIELEIQKETGKGDAFAAVVKRFEKEKKAMVILRSDCAKYLGQNPPAIPALVGACNNPKELGIVQNLAQPEGKITGVTYSLGAESQFETFVVVHPKMKKIMLLLMKGHAGTPIDQEQTKAACKKFKLEYSEAICENKEQLLEAVRANKDKVSAFIIGSQSLIMDNAASIVKESGTTFTFSYSSKPVNDGALCGFAADNVKLGVLLAESLADIVVNGKAISQVPVKFDTKPQLFINAATAEKFGIEIPYEILKAAKIIGAK